MTFQDNIIHYLKNSLLLPLVIRSNRTISKYFVGYDTTISCLKFDGSAGISTLGKTKHASWFLTSVLSKIIPHLDNLETCEEYLEGLGRRHAQIGVRVEHLDLLALVYCSAVRAVVAGQGVRGGPLFDTTRAWFHFLRAIVSVMKRGYKGVHAEIIVDDGASVIDLQLEEEFKKLGGKPFGRDRYGGHRPSLCPRADDHCCDDHSGDEDETGRDETEDPANQNHRSPSGGSGSHNFVVMKRRNAFWNLECTTDNLPHAASLHGTSNSGLLASLTSVNGIGGSGSANKCSLSSPIKPRRTRQFSLQF